MGNPFNGNANISNTTKQLKTLANSSPSDVADALFGNGSGNEATVSDKRTNKLSDGYLEGYENADSSGNLIMDKLSNIEKLMAIVGDPFNTITVKKPFEKDLTDNQNWLDHDIFLFKSFASTTDNPDFLFEDPLNIGFILSIEEDSSLLRTVGDDTILNFINEYSNIPEIAKRGKMLDEFKNVLQKLFYIHTKDIVWDNSLAVKKAYYLTKIEGLDKFMDKIVNYGSKDSKLTITLTEDVSMLASYLSELYNNLTYSYKNNRYIFPDNLLRFNMRILMQDQRKFISGKDENGYGIYLQPSYIMINLYDCNFDFSNSKSFTNAIEIGGYGKSNKSFETELTFDVYYKSVERVIDPQLIKDALMISTKSNDYVPSQNNDPYFTRDVLKFQEFKKRNTDLIDLKKNLQGSTLGRTIRQQTSNLFSNLKNELSKTISEIPGFNTLNRLVHENVNEDIFSKIGILFNGGDQTISQQLLKAKIKHQEGVTSELSNLKLYTVPVEPVKKDEGKLPNYPPDPIKDYEDKHQDTSDGIDHDYKG